MDLEWMRKRQKQWMGFNVDGEGKGGKKTVERNR